MAANMIDVRKYIIAFPYESGKSPTYTAMLTTELQTRIKTYTGGLRRSCGARQLISMGF